MPEAVEEVNQGRSFLSTPMMSAEGSHEVEVEATPVRVTGFVALLLGLISFSAVLGASLLVIPVGAIVLATIALRPYRGERPIGYLAAQIAIFCAVLFAVWGISERHFKARDLGGQAERFAGEWLRLVGQGELELAVELQVHPTRRQPASMPLKDYYQRSETARGLMDQFREQEFIPELIAAGSQPQWVLDREPHSYTLYGRELTRTVWRDVTGRISALVKVEMEYFGSPRVDSPAWKVELVSTFIDDSDRV